MRPRKLTAARDRLLIFMMFAYALCALGMRHWSFAIASEDTVCQAEGLLSMPAFDSDNDGNQVPDTYAVTMPDPAIVSSVTLPLPRLSGRTAVVTALVASSHIQEVPIPPPERRV